MKISDIENRDLLMHHVDLLSVIPGFYNVVAPPLKATTSTSCCLI